MAEEDAENYVKKREIKNIWEPVFQDVCVLEEKCTEVNNPVEFIFMQENVLVTRHSNFIFQLKNVYKWKNL